MTSIWITQIGWPLLRGALIVTAYQLPAAIIGGIIGGWIVRRRGA